MNRSMRMRNPFRTLAGVIAGILAGTLVIMLVEGLGSLLYSRTASTPRTRP
jgi:hypothetical protein